MNKLIGIFFCSFLLFACGDDTEHVTFLFRIEDSDTGPTHANLRTVIYGPGRIKVDKVLAHLDVNFDSSIDTVMVVAENLDTVGPIVFTLNGLNPSTSYMVRLEALALGHPIKSNDFSFFTTP